ncbi:hypothetical protein [Limnoglobus roseus]|uniref:Uncharacterized protein n=1 Tax=Limnoglobus roseus TaxID=2598579 RepID=A0A5C1AR99_9BACT|nr:hypothetical protein [Limnoglobus roseus]QEL20727.1 hypothetical protein PX52LOC_07836 [Limnoglobus roseus]
MPTQKNSRIFDRFQQWRVRPVTLATAADAVSAVLEPIHRTALRDSPFTDLGRFDYCLGVIVRARLGLWAGVQVSDHDGRVEACPDAASRLVIQEVWLREQEQYILTHPTTLAATRYSSMSTWGQIGMSRCDEGMKQ